MHCVQWGVSEVQGKGNVTVQLSVVGFVLVCECQWMGVRLSWVIVRRLLSAGTE